MKKFLVAAIVALSLGGCAQLQEFGQKVDTAWQIVTTAAVSPTQIIVAANAFDAAEATATQYLVFCHTNPSVSACALSTRQKIVAAVRAGRASRDQLEPYVEQGSAGPSALYNALTAAVSTLQTSTPATGK